MQTHEPFGQHHLLEGGFSAPPSRFDNPDDRLAFIQANVEFIEPDARKGYAAHGRGIVMLQQSGQHFVRSWYAVPDPGDLDHLRPEATEDLEGYDPETQILVGITEQDGTFVGFWRMEFRITT